MSFEEALDTEHQSTQCGEDMMVFGPSFHGGPTRSSQLQPCCLVIKADRLTTGRIFPETGMLGTSHKIWGAVVSVLALFNQFNQMPPLTPQASGFTRDTSENGKIGLRTTD